MEICISLKNLYSVMAQDKVYNQPDMSRLLAQRIEDVLGIDQAVRRKIWLHAGNPETLNVDSSLELLFYFIACVRVYHVGLTELLNSESWTKETITIYCLKKLFHELQFPTPASIFKDEIDNTDRFMSHIMPDEIPYTGVQFEYNEIQTVVHCINNSSMVDNLALTKSSSPPVMYNILKWNELTIVFVNNHTVELHGGGKKENMSFDALGFSDNRRADAFDEKWTLLKFFAEHRGEIKSSTDIAKKISSLRSQLKRAIPHLEGNPIVFDNKRCAYITTFQVSSRIPHEPDDQGTRQDILDDFEIQQETPRGLVRQGRNDFSPEN